MLTTTSETLGSLKASVLGGSPPIRDCRLTREPYVGIGSDGSATRAEAAFSVIASQAHANPTWEGFESLRIPRI